ncbi:MAG TPA: zf-HC2 domain-containing protein [Gaiellaceae bacterium]|jgi:anti-sigma factor RsiW
MLLPALPRGCQQAREAASLRLDGELPELGSTRLANHLRQCEACSAYAAELEAIADRLRSAPFEHPGPQVLVRGAAAHRRIAPLVAGAAAVIAGLAASVGGLLHTPSSTPAESTLSAPALALSDAAILRSLGPLGLAERDRTYRGGPTPV